MKRALISVYDKTGITKFAKDLTKQGWEIISTGGTAKVLRKARIKITPVEKITGNPEVFDGRLKTISFQIAGALLYHRQNKKHQKEAKKLGILPINMVVCNLYPFEKVTVKRGCSLATAVENIDIGGPSLIRAAAKNFKDVIIVVDPRDYKKIIHFLKSKKEVPLKTRLALAQKVFQRIAKYDRKISSYLKNVL